MARRKKKQNQQEDETLVDVVGSVETLQDYVEQNSSKIMSIIGLFVLVLGGILAYYFLYKIPRNDDATLMMSQAQAQFEKDSFALALDNPGGSAKGFLDIIEDYSGTNAANTASYYAGISYLNLGNYDMAIDYLNDYSPKDKVTPAQKYAALGDAYAELGDKDKAISNYKKATTTHPNGFSTPMNLLKLGMYLQNNGDMEGAKQAYAKIKENYPKSSVYGEAEKYLIRAGGQ